MTSHVLVALLLSALVLEALQRLPAGQPKRVWLGISFQKQTTAGLAMVLNIIISSYLINPVHRQECSGGEFWQIIKSADSVTMLALKYLDTPVIVVQE